MLISFFLLVFHSVRAQNNGVEQQIWLDVNPHYEINENLEYYGDAGYRTIVDGIKWNRLHFRPSIRYKPNPLYQFHGGIGFFFVFTESGADRFELRPWQDFRIKWPSGVRYYFTHQLRFEERWSYIDIFQSRSSFEVRMRYKLAINFDLVYFNEGDKIYSTAFTELFFPVIDEVDEFYRNRNRSGLGIGYLIFEKYKFEFIMNLQRSRFTPEDELSTSEYAYQLKFHWYWKKKIKTEVEQID